MKRCSKCGSILPESEFYKCGKGLTSWCKHCYKERRLAEQEMKRRLHPRPYIPTKEEIVEFYVNQEHSLPWIAKKLGTNYSLVRNKAIEYGIPIRRLKQSIEANLSHKYIDTSKWKKQYFSPERREKMSILMKQRRLNAPRAGFSLKQNGYYAVTIGKDKNRPLHDVIMEEHIGRKLTKDECVHHINHIRNDNRIENLQLMTKSEHSRLHCAERIAAGEKLNHFPIMVGEQVPSAKLTDEQAREIKHSKEHYKILMERYGVSKSVINKIRSGRAWKHIQ